MFSQRFALWSLMAAAAATSFDQAPLREEPRPKDYDPPPPRREYKPNRGSAGQKTYSPNGSREQERRRRQREARNAKAQE